MATDFGFSPTDELHDLRMSQRAVPLLERVRCFVRDVVAPMSLEFHRLGQHRPNRWSYSPEQLQLLEGAKEKARQEKLWNLFLPDVETGEGLKNLDYAYIAAETGKNKLAAECMNCSAPDTGNMEVLERVATPEQKAKWLKPLLAGEIRSAYAMTEPDQSSSDAKNVRMRAVLDADEWVINGEKFYVTGAGDPRCKVMIAMTLTSPGAPVNQQHSQILVPMDTPGVKIMGPMHVFGEDDAPHGHMHIKFEDARVPRCNVLLGEGRGFEISQLRLGPGRIHHCMRSIGQAEVALDLLVARGTSREAFGKKVALLGGNLEIISRARIDIEAMRLMVLKAARAMDVLGNRDARIWVHMAKAMIPERVCRIIDQAIQIHGATGFSQWTPLAGMYNYQRTLRIADGPDEVHHFVVGRNEVHRFNPNK